MNIECKKEKINVLILDDDEVYLVLTRRLIINICKSAFFAKNGVEALSFCKK